MKALLLKLSLVVVLIFAVACSSSRPPAFPPAAFAPAAVAPTAEPTTAAAQVAPTVPTVKPLTTAVVVPATTVPPVDTDEPLASLFPVTIENCGITFTYDKPIEKAISLNQHVTEMMLALGLEDQMIGTAYIDDFILPELLNAYQSLEVLADEYPSREVILNLEPDFIYGGFGSAFSDENSGSQESLQDLGINSYLTHAVCDEGADTIEDIYTDITAIGAIGGVPDMAEALIAAMKADLDSIESEIGDDVEPAYVFMFDSGNDAPYAAACCGMVNALIESAGGENIFGDVDGRWTEVSWEEVLDMDPDVIILTDAVWSTAEEKIELMNNSPVLSEMSAVVNNRFVILKFSSLVPGIRIPGAIQDIADVLYPDKFP